MHCYLCMGKCDGASRTKSNSNSKNRRRCDTWCFCTFLYYCTTLRQIHRSMHVLYKKYVTSATVHTSGRKIGPFVFAPTRFPSSFLASSLPSPPHLDPWSHFNATLNHFFLILFITTNTMVCVCMHASLMIIINHRANLNSAAWRRTTPSSSHACIMRRASNHTIAQTS